MAALTDESQFFEYEKRKLAALEKIGNALETLAACVKLGETESALHIMGDVETYEQNTGRWMMG